MRGLLEGAYIRALYRPSLPLERLPSHWLVSHNKYQTRAHTSATRSTPCMASRDRVGARRLWALAPFNLLSLGSHQPSTQKSLGRLSRSDLIGYRSVWASSPHERAERLNTVDPLRRLASCPACLALSPSLSLSLTLCLSPSLSHFPSQDVILSVS